MIIKKDLGFISNYKIKPVKEIPSIEDAIPNVLYLVNIKRNIFQGYYLIVAEDGSKSLGELGGRSYVGGQGISVDLDTDEISNDLVTKGGTINGSLDIEGDLNIKGDVFQQGNTYETHAEQLYTKKDIIITREDAKTGLAENELTGIEAKCYDGINDGQLVFDKDGEAKVGDKNDLQPLLTRSEVSEMKDGNVLEWNATLKKAVTSKHTYEASILKLTKAEWEAYDKSKLKDKQSVIITDDNQIKDISTMPIGGVVAFAGDKTPQGFLICNGNEYRITDYPELYEAIGDKYGSATSGYFRVPDYRGRFLEGSDTVQPPSYTVMYIIRATNYMSVPKNAIDDTAVTNSNTWSAENINDRLNYIGNLLKTKVNNISSNNILSFKWTDRGLVLRVDETEFLVSITQI